MKTIITFLLFSWFLSPFARGEGKITIIFTTSTNGVLKACPCAARPLGGLARRKALLDSIRTGEGDFLLVDSGDFLTTMGRKRQDRYVIRAYEMLGYDAVNIGDQELVGGWDFFGKNLLGSGLKLISANLYCSKTGGSVASAFVMKRLKGVKIAVLGLVSPEAFAFFTLEQRRGFEVRPYSQILRRRLEQLRDRADIIVLLSHASDQENIRVAQDFKGVDVIIGGHTQTGRRDCHLLINGKIILKAGVDGEYVGRLDLFLDENKRIKDHKFELIPIGENIKEDKGLAEFIEAYFKKR